MHDAHRTHSATGTPAINRGPGVHRPPLRYRESVHEAKVLTVSDSVHTGEREDRTGPDVVTFLEVHGFTVPAADRRPGRRRLGGGGTAVAG